MRTIMTTVDNEEEKKEGRSPDLLRITLVGLAILISWSGVLRPRFSFDVAAFSAVLLGGLPMLKEAFLNLKAKSITAEVAMSIGMIASLSIGEFLSAAFIAFFMLIAEFLDKFTAEKSRTAVRELIKLSPKRAVVKRDGVEMEVDISTVRHGDTVIVKSGEKIPVDGIVIAGQASVNQASITGESMPVEKSVGDEVFAGTINEIGVVQVRVNKVGEDTTLARIIRLVEEAEGAKAPIQRVADRYAAYFVPTVLGVAALTFMITRNLISSIAVVVVACPCAVALATPLAVVASVGKAAKRGIIVKGGVYLEELGRIDTVVMDKTGTLTLGEPRVTDIRCFGKHNEQEIITLAATVEKHSEHSLAKAIARKANDYGVKVPDHEECQVIRGKGVVASYNGQTVIIGSRELLKEKGIDVPQPVDEYMHQEEMAGKTAILITHDGVVCGVICVSDVLRESTIRAIEELKGKGIKLVMLTGDNPRTAQAIAGQVGIHEIVAGMLPEEKVDEVKALVKQGRKVVMVGDGINDAPALAQASVGIAMGAAGTDVAMEAADVALMTDDLTKVPEAMSIGRRTFNVIKQNIASSIIFNVVGVTLASMGLLNPMMAAVAHALPDFILFLNSSRLIRG